MHTVCILSLNRSCIFVYPYMDRLCHVGKKSILRLSLPGLVVTTRLLQFGCYPTIRTSEVFDDLQVCKINENLNLLLMGFKYDQDFISVAGSPRTARPCCYRRCHIRLYHFVIGWHFNFHQHAGRTFIEKCCSLIWFNPRPNVTLLCGRTQNQMLHSNVCQSMTKWYSQMWYPL